MTEAKPVVFLAYVLIGFALTVLAPLLYRHRAMRHAVASASKHTPHAIRLAIGAVLGLSIMTLLPWWLREPGHWPRLSVSALQAAAVVLLTLAVSWMLTRQSSVASNSPANTRWRALIYAVFSLALLCLVFSTGWLLSFPGSGLWHHWSAYVGPALLVAEGVLPMYDIPAQYGLGVTLLLAQGCQVNCWSTLYWVAGSMTVAMTALLGYLALQLNGSRHPLSVLATLAIVLVCGLFWTANPQGLAATLTYPSTTGLRFLPGVLVLALLVRHARRGRVGPLLPPTWGHILWLVCIMWSPEAGVHATMLWAPYYVWTYAWAQDHGSLALGFGKAVARLVLVLVGGLALIALGYRLLAGDFPEVRTYFIYLLYPPGPLPVDPWGTVWFTLACMVCWGLGWWYMPRRTNANPGLAISSWLSALLCFACFTYYLGRSHDNNILNLLPLFALMLQAARAIAPAGTVRMLSTTLLAACLGWLPMFGYGSLHTTIAQRHLLEFSPGNLAKAFNRNPSVGNFYARPEQASADLESALNTIQGAYGESVVIFDQFLLVDTNSMRAPWNAFSGPANFVYVPPEVRRVYLARVAKRLNRAGWVLYENDPGTAAGVSQYLQDYESVYKRSEALDFGIYRAVRFVPRQGAPIEAIGTPIDTPGERRALAQ